MIPKFIQYPFYFVVLWGFDGYHYLFFEIFIVRTAVEQRKPLFFKLSGTTSWRSDIRNPKDLIFYTFMYPDIP